MTFGLTLEKLIVIAVIAAMFIGPARLPAFAAALARTVRRAREFLRTSSDRVKEELGTDLADTDWRSLDPRQYDPRRIIREALLDAPPAAEESTSSAQTSVLPDDIPRRQRSAASSLTTDEPA